MRLTLPLAAAAIALVGAGCTPPEPEGRITDPIVPKAEGTAPATTDVKPDSASGEAKSTPEGNPKDETTGIAPITAPPAAGGKTESEQGKVGG